MESKLVQALRKTHDQLKVIGQKVSMGEFENIESSLLNARDEAIKAESISMNFKIGQTVRVTKNDPMDDRVGIPKRNRWIEGETLVITKIEIVPWGTFLYGKLGQNLSAKRAEIIDDL